MWLRIATEQIGAVIETVAAIIWRAGSRIAGTAFTRNPAILVIAIVTLIMAAVAYFPVEREVHQIAKT